MVFLNIKKSIALIFTITLSLNLSAQSTNQNSLCYKVTGPGLNAPSYVFGTIHLISKKDFFLPKSTETAFKGCKTLALEVDLNMDKATKKEVGKSAILPNGKFLTGFGCDSGYDIGSKISIEHYKIMRKMDSNGLD